jgi:hypothetical protein
MKNIKNLLSYFNRTPFCDALVKTVKKRPEKK